MHRYFGTSRTFPTAQYLYNPDLPRGAASPPVHGGNSPDYAYQIRAGRHAGSRPEHAKGRKPSVFPTPPCQVSPSPGTGGLEESIGVSMGARPRRGRSRSKGDRKTPQNHVHTLRFHAIMATWPSAASSHRRRLPRGLCSHRHQLTLKTPSGEGIHMRSGAFAKSRKLLRLSHTPRAKSAVRLPAMRYCRHPVPEGKGFGRILSLGYIRTRPTVRMGRHPASPAMALTATMAGWCGGRWI